MSPPPEADKHRGRGRDREKARARSNNNNKKEVLLKVGRELGQSAAASPFLSQALLGHSSPLSKTWG